MCYKTSSAPQTLDDLIEAAFERAGLVTADQEVAAQLASRTVARWLARVGRLDLIRLLGPSGSGSGIRRATMHSGLQAQAV
jgi:hypothetical protein